MIKSPLFHMGNKADLMEQLIRYFPKPEEVRRFYDVFGAQEPFLSTQGIRIGSTAKKTLKWLKSYSKSKRHPTVK